MLALSSYAFLKSDIIKRFSYHCFWYCCDLMTKIFQFKESNLTLFFSEEVIIKE